jgi:hypothetical protein
MNRRDNDENSSHLDPGPTGSWRGRPILHDHYSPAAGQGMVCGEFADFGTALYDSAVNYTSLGYDDIIMTPSWRLLGPLETANGTLLFGVSTAMIFAVMLWLIQAEFMDLKD